MDESSRAYYLQQMGVDLWTVRERQHTKVQLMVILEWSPANPWHGSKAEILLTNMLSSVGFSQEDTFVICVVPLKFLDDASKRDRLIKEQILQMKPKMMLILGEFLSELTNQSLSGMPVKSSKHPLDLLNHGNQKKQAFQDLIDVKNQLFTCA